MGHSGYRTRVGFNSYYGRIRGQRQRRRSFSSNAAPCNWPRDPPLVGRVRGPSLASTPLLRNSGTARFQWMCGATHAQLSGKDSQYYFTGLRSGWPTAQCESISLDVSRKNESVSCKLCCKKPLDVSSVRCDYIDSLEVRQLYEQRQKRIKEGTLHNLVALGEIKQSLESRLRNARLYGNALSQKILGSPYLTRFLQGGRHRRLYSTCGFQNHHRRQNRASCESDSVVKGHSICPQ